MLTVDTVLIDDVDYDDESLIVSTDCIANIVSDSFTVKLGRDPSEQPP